MRRLGLIAVILAASIVGSARAGDPLSHYPAELTTKVPANGYSTTASPVLPKDARQIITELDDDGGDLERFFEDLRVTFAATKSKKDRVLTCVYLYADATGLGRLPQGDEEVEFDTEAASVLFLFLAACTRIALLEPSTSSATAAASSPCRQAASSVAIKVTGRRAEVDGKLKRAKPAVRIGCRRTSTGVRLKIRPRSRKKTLRQVVGPKLGIGIGNAGSSSLSAHLTYQAPK